MVGEVLWVVVNRAACIGQVHRASDAGRIAGEKRREERQKQIEGEQSAH